jgi:hypothetical protein
MFAQQTNNFKIFFNQYLAYELGFNAYLLRNKLLFDD